MTKFLCTAEKFRGGILALLTVAAAGCLCIRASAGDAEAAAKMQSGRAAMEKGSYAAAAKAFTDAELLADSPALGAEALAAAIEAERLSRMYYREFLLIEKMLNKYPTDADYPALVKREYAIADSYRDGYRQRAFAALDWRWLSWLLDVDKTEETYRAALARAPFADEAPNAKLDLALHQLRHYRNIAGREEALNTLRELIRDYPGTRAAYYAQLELANALFQLAGLGDGDGARVSEGIKVLEKFIDENPGASELPEMETMLLKAKDLAAERIMGTADFYLRMKRPAAAEHYLRRIIHDYPEAAAASEAERKLTSMDSTFIPSGFAPMQPEERAAAYPIYEMPPNYERLLVAPENSDGRWLLPIYDLNLPRRAEKAPVGGEQ